MYKETAKVRLMWLKIILLFILPLNLLLLSFAPFKPFFQGNFESLDAILIWIVTGGGSMILVGYVEAYLLENWTDWHGFPRWVKLLFPIVMSAIFGVIAQSALVLGLLDYIPAGLKIVILAGVNWLFSQIAYKGVKEGEYAASARG